MKQTLFILLLCCFAGAQAAELFGVALVNATRDELRVAVKNAGVKLVQEAGVDSFYDIYKGDSVLHNADKFYLGFVKSDKKFAFAEYEFTGLKQPVMLNKLKHKYGPATLTKGKFITDQLYSWDSEGVKISFYQDWKSYKTRLTYFNPQKLQQLREEKKQFVMTSNRQNAVYLEAAY